RNVHKYGYSWIRNRKRPSFEKRKKTRCKKALTRCKRITIGSMRTQLQDNTMNPVEKLKLTTSTKILIALGSVIGTISLTLFVDLIQSSTAYAKLKTHNPIDAIINMEIPLQVSSQSIL